MARVLYSGIDEYGQSSEVMLGCAIGDIIPHFGTTPPRGTLVCDGSEVSREAYAELYQEIGSLCGQGDGSTTFNLPDLRGRWLMGADAARGAGTEIAEGLPNATGTLRIAGGTDISSSTRLVSDKGEGALGALITEVNYSPVEGATTTPGEHLVAIKLNLSLSNAIYGASQHVTPASVVVLPCIVYE